MRELLLLAPLILSACATQAGHQVVPVTSVPPGSTCVQSTALDSYIGQPASADLGARLMGASTARVLRWVPHGSMVTMEHRADRLTVWLDSGNRVQRLTCG
jgi:hypothetical protein